MDPVRLRCHPATPGPSVRALTVAVERVIDLTVRFRLDAVPGALRIPAPTTPRFAEGLWQHTCFEAFVGRADGAAYHELNFSPSGEWAHWVFSSYRERAGGEEASVGSHVAPLAAWRRDASSLALDVRVDLASLGQTRDSPLRLGLSAVVEDRDGGRSYWAIAHFGEAPDFHDARSFALRLEPVRTE
jgi:hypothetical protein